MSISFIWKNLKSVTKYCSAISLLDFSKVKNDLIPSHQDLNRFKGEWSEQVFRQKPFQTTETILWIMLITEKVEKDDVIWFNFVQTEVKLRL